MLNLRKLAIVTLLLAASTTAIFAQTKHSKRPRSKRDSLKQAMLLRDSLMHNFKRSDTSINSLLQRVEYYTTAFNEISNTLTQPLDTVQISQQLPQVEKRISLIRGLADTHESSTLRYLYVLRDFLTHNEDNLDDWQDDLNTLNSKMIQTQQELYKFKTDSAMNIIPVDSALQKIFFAQRQVVEAKWHKLDSASRKTLLKVGIMQDRVAAAYINILDEEDQINAKIKNFGLQALTDRDNYIWSMPPAYNSFGKTLNKTISLNWKLLNIFVTRDLLIHALGMLMFLLVFWWIYSNRKKVIRNYEDPEVIFSQACYATGFPLISALVIAAIIYPNFYDHPPVVFLEIVFTIATVLVWRVVAKTCPPIVSSFLQKLFFLSFIYSLSNLFIEVSNIDRVVVLLCSLAGVIVGYKFLQELKKSEEHFFPYSKLSLRIFVALQAIAFVCNFTGRFGLGKIIAVASTYNLWLALSLYLVVQMIIQGLFLQFEANKSERGFGSMIDFKILEKKIRNLLNIVAVGLWLVMLMQNLNIQDYVFDNVGEFLGQSRTVGNTSFSLASVIIFVAVLWLSSIVSKIVAYIFDFVGQHSSDVNYKKRTRTSMLLVRISVFSIGFLLAISASAFPLDKLTIIISAFGVGIGFGLQNVVNNLVSGLILAFEKPIQVGDTIEVDSRTGVISEIGIRSSKLSIGNGAEVIIPNGDLISKNVINWTLSDNNRQVELIVRVAYGSDIVKVTEILKDVLAKNEDVMTSRAPSVYVHQLTDSSVDFRMFFWSADVGKWVSLKSRVLSEIYNAFSENGIDIPASQQDVMLHFPDGIPTAGGVTETKEAPTAKKPETDKSKD